ncbi:50S ribosomal protein L4 [Sesbania bispinosa]|nr:50S ribosomal protein L4 [Sesbania bispinosa]
MESKESSRSGESVPHPPDPPDGGGQDQQTGVSFRDKVLGNDLSPSATDTAPQMAGGGVPEGPSNPNSLHGSMHGIIEERSRTPHQRLPRHGQEKALKGTIMTRKRPNPLCKIKNVDKPSTSSGPANTIPTNKEVAHSKPAPKTVMIGGTRVFDLGNGLKTSMKLKKISDHQFTFQGS